MTADDLPSEEQDRAWTRDLFDRLGLPPASDAPLTPERIRASARAYLEGVYRDVLESS